MSINDSICITTINISKIVDIKIEFKKNIHETHNVRNKRILIKKFVEIRDQ